MLPIVFVIVLVGIIGFLVFAAVRKNKGKKMGENG
jgi:hypothetical protein